MKNALVTDLPHRLERLGGIGWTVTTFANARDAAAFFQERQDCAMPCWRRMEVVNGELTLVR